MISILIPLYNSEKYIEKCLLSIIKQTSKNYEVIIIDDGSTDNSYKICQCYQDELKMKLYTRNNKGVTYTRNELVKYAEGDYFIFLDSDDMLDENAIQILTSIVFNNNKIEMILFDIEYFNYESEIKKLSNIDNMKIENFTSLEIAIDYLTLKRRGYVAGILINKKCWFDLNIIFDLEKYIEDWFPMFYYAVNSNKSYYIHEKLYLYRQHPCATISTSDFKVVDNYVKARNGIYTYCKKINQLPYIYLNCFKVKTDLDILHEVIKLDKYNFYSKTKQYNCGEEKMFISLINKELRLTEKLKYLAYKLKIYHLLNKLKAKDYLKE